MKFKKSLIFSAAIIIVVTAITGIGYGFADDAMTGTMPTGIKKILQASDPIGLTLDEVDGIKETAPVNDIEFLNHPAMTKTDNFTGDPSTVKIEGFEDLFEVLDYFLTQGSMQGNACEDKIYKMIGYYAGWILKPRAGICSNPPDGPYTSQINGLDIQTDLGGDGLMTLILKDAISKADQHGCVETKKVMETFDAQYACKDTMTTLYYLIGFPGESKLADAIEKDKLATVEKDATCNHKDAPLGNPFYYNNYGLNKNWDQLSNCADLPSKTFICNKNIGGDWYLGMKCIDNGVKFVCTKLDETTVDVAYADMKETDCEFKGMICDQADDEDPNTAELKGMVCELDEDYPCEGNKVSPLFQLDKLASIIEAICSEEPIQNLFKIPFMAGLEEELGKATYDGTNPDKDWEFLTEEEKEKYYGDFTIPLGDINGDGQQDTFDLTTLEPQIADYMANISDLPELSVADVRDNDGEPLNTAQHLLSPYLDEKFNTSAYPVNNKLNYVGAAVERNGKPDGIALVSYYFIYPTLLNITGFTVNGSELPIAAIIGMFPPADFNLMYYRFLDDTTNGDRLLHFAGRDLSWLENNGLLSLYEGYKLNCELLNDNTAKFLCLISQVQQLAADQQNKCFPIEADLGIGIKKKYDMLTDRHCFGNFMSVGIESPDINSDGISDIVVVNRHQVQDNDEINPSFYTYATVYEGKDADPGVDYPAFLDLFEYTSAVAFGENVLDPYDTAVADGTSVLVTVDQGVERIFKSAGGGYSTELYTLDPPEGYEGFRPYQITAVDLGAPCNGMAITRAKIDNELDTIEFADFFQIYHNKSKIAKGHPEDCKDYEIVGEFKVNPNQFADDPNALAETPQISAITYTKGNEARQIPPGIWVGDQRIYTDKDKKKYALSYFYPLTETVTLKDGFNTAIKTVDTFNVAKAVVANDDQINVYGGEVGVSGGVKSNNTDIYSNLGSVLGYPIIYQDIPLDFSFECNCDFANMLGNAEMAFMLCNILGFEIPPGVTAESCDVTCKKHQKCTQGLGDGECCTVASDKLNDVIPSWLKDLDTNGDGVPDFCQCTREDKDVDMMGDHLEPALGCLAIKPVCDNCKPDDLNCVGAEQTVPNPTPPDWPAGWIPIPANADPCFNPLQTDSDEPDDGVGDICEPKPLGFGKKIGDFNSENVIPDQLKVEIVNLPIDICPALDDTQKSNDPKFMGWLEKINGYTGAKGEFCYENDRDCDGIPNIYIPSDGKGSTTIRCDNCQVYNPDQKDDNTDGIGNACVCPSGEFLIGAALDPGAFAAGVYKIIDSNPPDGIPDWCEQQPQSFNFNIISTAYAEDSQQKSRSGSYSGSQYFKQSTESMQTVPISRNQAYTMGGSSNMLGKMGNNIGKGFAKYFNLGMNFLLPSKDLKFLDPESPGLIGKTLPIMGMDMMPGGIGGGEEEDAAADLSQMPQQEAKPGNVTVLISKMAEDTTCGNCVEGGGIADDYKEWSEECIATMGGDVAPKDGIPDSCKPAPLVAGECSVEIGRNGKPAAGLGPLNSPYDKLIRDLNDDVNVYACEKAVVEHPDRACSKYDLFAGELGYYHAMCAIQKQTLEGVPAPAYPSWIMYQLGGMGLKNENYGKTKNRPGIAPIEELKYTATRMVATQDSDTFAGKGIVSNEAALNFAPSIVADMKQQIIPDSMAFAENTNIGGFDALTINLGTKKEDPLMRLIVTPIPAGSDAAASLVSGSSGSFLKGGSAIKFEAEGFAGVDGVAWAKEGIGIPSNDKRNFDYDFVVKRVKACVDSLADDPAKDVSYGNITKCLDDDLKALGKEWDGPTGHTDVKYLVTMGESEPLLKMMVIPLSAAKYDVGGAGCGCNFGATNPPALSILLSYGIVAATGTAIIIIRRRKK